MKKILFAAYSLNIGGIETALLNLTSELLKSGDYDITVALEKKEGLFLNSIDKNINIIEYTPDESKNFIIRKIKNLYKRLIFIKKYRNKFDYAISYATYSLSSSFISRIASKKRALWVHNNYLDFFEKNEEKYKDFFNQLHVNEFNKIIFVSNESKNDFEEIFNCYSSKLLVCNNLINGEEIINKSEEINDGQIFSKKNNEFVFVNIGRHDEKQKKLSRLIYAAQKLKNDNLNFKIIMVGNGPETENYKKLVKELNLEDYIDFVGAKKNPYVYYNCSNAVVMTSEFEGYPVVYLESMILNKPIVTTDVSDSKIDIDEKYGLVCSKDIDDIYKKMKQMICEGFEIKNKFDVNLYNKEIINKIEKLFYGEV